MAMKFHPDKNQDDPDAVEHFKEAKEAYDVLSNAQKRAAYDQFGHAGVDPSAAAGAGGFGGGASFSDIFGDVFGDIFGGGGRGGRSRAYRGSDLRYNMELSLEDAAFGTSVKIKIPTLVTCKTCSGAYPAGLFLGTANLSPLSWQWPHDQRSLWRLSWPGSSGRTQDPVGESACRRG